MIKKFTGPRAIETHGHENSCDIHDLKIFSSSSLKFDWKHDSIVEICEPVVFRILYFLKVEFDTDDS